MKKQHTLAGDIFPLLFVNALKAAKTLAAQEIKTAGRDYVFVPIDEESWVFYCETDDYWVFKQKAVVPNKNPGQKENGRKLTDVHFWGQEDIILFITDNECNVIWVNEYTPFGGLVDGESAFAGESVFAGHEFDADVRLYYARARWFDSDKGRFMSVDPIKDGVNWYAYCVNNPFKYIDPSGLENRNVYMPKEEEPHSNCWDYHWGYNPNMYDYIRPDSEKVLKLIKEILMDDNYDEQLVEYLRNIYLYTLINEKKIEGENAREREAVEEIKWQVETSLRKLRMYRNSGKFSYLTSIKERGGKNPEIGDLNKEELLTLAKTMKNHVDTTKVTYALTTTLIQWVTRLNILSHNMKLFSPRATKDPSTPTGHKGKPLVTEGSNTRQNIGGRVYSGHAVDRMQEQGIPPSIVENVIDHGQEISGKMPGTTAYYDSESNITVITNTITDAVITVDYGFIKQ